MRFFVHIFETFLEIYLRFKLRPKIETVNISKSASFIIRNSKIRFMTARISIYFEHFFYEIRNLTY